MEKNVFAVIVGAGASGLAAAVFLGRKFKNHAKKKIVVLERQNKCGKKLLATGGGRCNLSNKSVSPTAYYGDRALIDSVLERFGAEDTIKFFESLGMIMREDEAGRLYPYSGKSATVLECLYSECQRLNIEIETDCAVEDIQPKKSGYRIVSNKGIWTAKNVILACGTGATPQTGGTNIGFEWLNRLGIDYEPPLAALTPIRTVQHYPLKGVRAKGTVKLKADSKVIAQSEGEIQFTDNGLSGICVFDLAHYVSEFLSRKTINGVSCHQAVLSVDLFPSYGFSELCGYLNKRKSLVSESDSLWNGALDTKLGSVLVKSCHLDGKRTADLSPKQIKVLAAAAKDFSFIPEECSLQNAQVCSGGATVKAVLPQTLECRKYKGLYITGELLNVDGICGGFNLQWAWASAFVAAESVALI